MTQKDHDQHRPTRRTLLKGAAVAATATIPTAGTATAETSHQGVIANGLSLEGGDRKAFISGLVDGTFTLSRTEPAETLAGRMRNEFQANRDAWLRYGNWLLEEFEDVESAGTVTVGVDVKVSRWIDNDEIVPTTIRAEYDDATRQLTDLEWVRGEPDDPDYVLPIKNRPAEFAADDLQSFRQRFIGQSEDDHKLPSKEFVSRNAGKYVAATRLNGETAQALSVLIGDLNGA